MKYLNTTCTISKIHVERVRLSFMTMHFTDRQQNKLQCSHYCESANTIWYYAWIWTGNVSKMVATGFTNYCFAQHYQPWLNRWHTKQLTVGSIEHVGANEHVHYMCSCFWWTECILLQLMNVSVVNSHESITLAQCVLRHLACQHGYG